ncbi:MAG: type II secretion system protein [Bacilli bacterium]|nr:type II secretion system protein [Bacilli bacterium]
MNKKGFTLVELLAAITLLGILMGIAIPAIMHLITGNRNQIYVTDAKKLIALAEYNVRAKSSQIQLPSDESDIEKTNYGMFTFEFLDNGDFENTPNDGVYDPRYTFVVVKNVGGKLFYSVMIVEKYKNKYYKGIELISSEELVDANYKTIVKEETESHWSSVKDSIGTPQYTY